MGGRVGLQLAVDAVQPARVLHRLIGPRELARAPCRDAAWTVEPKLVLRGGHGEFGASGLDKLQAEVLKLARGFSIASLGTGSLLVRIGPVCTSGPCVLTCRLPALLAG